MPYYYLLSEVPDSVDERICDSRTYKKPQTINLLLPSIHASREDNILDTTGDAEEAVRNLQSSCMDSGSWPSSEYCNKYKITLNHHPPTLTSVDREPKKCDNPHTPTQTQNSSLPNSTPLASTPLIPKYRPPCWSYDRVSPSVMEAARLLFYDRKRREAINAEVPRHPTDFELFAAWASLSRANQMAFAAQVNGSFTTDQVHVDSLTTQRAVTSLLACCPDSCSWPSFHFYRLQAQQRQPPPSPRHYHHQNPYHPYHQHHPYNPYRTNYPYPHPHPPIMHNPLIPRLL